MSIDLSNEETNMNIVLSYDLEMKITNTYDVLHSLHTCIFPESSPSWAVNIVSNEMAIFSFHTCYFIQHHKHLDLLYTTLKV